MKNTTAVTNRNVKNEFNVFAQIYKVDSQLSAVPSTRIHCVTHFITCPLFNKYSDIFTFLHFVSKGTMAPLPQTQSLID